MRIKRRNLNLSLSSWLNIYMYLIRSLIRTERERESGTEGIWSRWLRTRDRRTSLAFNIFLFTFLFSVLFLVLCSTVSVLAVAGCWCHFMGTSSNRTSSVAWLSPIRKMIFYVDWNGFVGLLRFIFILCSRSLFLIVRFVAQHTHSHA